MEHYNPPWRKPNLDAQEVLNIYLNDKNIRLKRLITCHGLEDKGGHLGLISDMDLRTSLLLDTNQFKKADITGYIGQFSDVLPYKDKKGRYTTSSSPENNFLSKCLVPPHCFDEILLAQCPLVVPDNKLFWNNVRYLLKIGGSVIFFPLIRKCLSFGQEILDKELDLNEEKTKSVECRDFDRAITRMGFNADYDRTGIVKMTDPIKQELEHSVFRVYGVKDKDEVEKGTFYVLTFKYTG